MTEHQFTLSTLQRTITPGFMIRQIKIENPTPFFIYVNIGSNTPTNLKSNYTINPNSSFITPDITTTDIAVVLGGVDPTKNLAKITVYSEATQSPGITPYQVALSVNSYPNYPVTIPVGTVNLDLPTITVDRFNTVLFLISSPDTNVGDGIPFILRVGIPGTGTVFHDVDSIDAHAAVIPYIPVEIPSIITPRVEFVIASLNTVRINAVQSDQTVYYKSARFTKSVSVPPLTTGVTHYFPAFPPYAILGIKHQIPIVPPANENSDISVRLLRQSARQYEVFNASYNGAYIGGLFYIVPRTIVVDQAGFLAIVFDNNHATDTAYFEVGVN